MGDQAVEAGRAGGGRGHGAPTDPLIEGGLELLQHRLVSGELASVELIQARVGERTEEQIHLLGPAMPRSELRALAAADEFVLAGLGIHRAVSSICPRTRNRS